MISDMMNGVLPSGYNYSEVQGKREWDVLLNLWNQKQSDFKPLQFTYKEFPKDGLSWSIDEAVGPFKFKMHRSLITDQRITEVNDCGLIGLSMINPQSRNVIITEGVSDFFSVKMNCEGVNVLGFTSLGGSERAKVIVLNLFDRIIYCADNDMAGMSGGIKVKSWFERYGKKVKIVNSSVGKDMTDMFMSNIKFSNFV